MYLRVMTVIFVLILGRFESARVLVHPLPEPLHWEKSFINDYRTNNLQDWHLFEVLSNKDIQSCRDAYKAMHVKPQPDTHAPLVSEEHFEITLCAGSFIENTIEIKIEHAVAEAGNDTFEANLVRCICKIPNEYYNSLTTREFYLAKTRNIKSLYIIDAQIHANRTIMGYWTYIPAEAFTQSIFRCFLPD